ncbi:hypothetical protein SAMN04487944_1091, partial [Gracilibacillus ureilyticus]
PHPLVKQNEKDVNEEAMTFSLLKNLLINNISRNAKRAFKGIRIQLEIPLK